MVERALAAREGLRRDAETDAWRLLHGSGDGVPGLVIEQFGGVLVAQWHEGVLKLVEGEVRAACERMMAAVGATGVYLKRFVKDRSADLRRVEALHSDATPWIGEAAPAEFAVREAGVRFLVRPYDGYSTGLFLEHRENRRRVRELAAGRRVLNTFAYTCGYSVCAALAGAAEVVSVDLSPKFLEWGRRNFAENGLVAERHVWLRADARDYLRRAARQGRRFDVVILDPPSFARDRRSKRVFAVTEELEGLVAGALALLNAGGQLLLCTNHRGIGWRRLERAVLEGAGGRAVEIVERPGLPADFPGDADFAKSLWARVD